MAGWRVLVLADASFPERSEMNRLSTRKSSLPLPEVHYTKNHTEENISFRTSSDSLTNKDDKLRNTSNDGAVDNKRKHAGGKDHNKDHILDSTWSLICIDSGEAMAIPEGTLTEFGDRSQEDNIVNVYGQDEPDDEGIGRKTSDVSLKLDDNGDTKWRGMLKGHYVDKATRKHCIGCNKAFTLKRRAFHCRRCGDVFCFKCVKYKRKLNEIANPDPEGRPRKVCLSCFEGDTLVFGCSRSLTEEFKRERAHAQDARVLSQRVNSLTTTFWRDQLDIRRECLRLLTGFQSKTSQTESRKAFQDIKGAMKTPTWQKSPYWDLERQSEQCRKCKDTKTLQLRKSSGNCRVCGLNLCKRCSSKDLLVFYPDEPETTDSGKPFLVVINVLGSPAKQPAISLHLYVCEECKEYITTQQKTNITWYRGPALTGPLKNLATMDTELKFLSSGISDELSDIQERFDARAEVKNDFTSSEKRKHIKEITQIQTKFDEYEREFNELKKLTQSVETSAQKRLLQNYIKSKHEFFMENKYAFRRLKNRMS